MAIGDYLATDDLTVLLGLVGITVFLLQNLYKPQALVHPILLGRQSDVGRVRKPGESAVYRNYATGLMGRLAERPAQEINVISDLIKPEFDNPRTLWSTKITNPQLKSRISAFASGLIKYAGLVPHDSNVLLLLNDGLEFLISDFALATHSIPSFTISSPALLSPVLEAHPPTAIITLGKFLPHVLELIYDSHESEHHTVIVVGDYDTNVAAKAGASIRVIKWTDVEAEGAKGEAVTSPAPKPDDIYTVSFFTAENGQMQGANLSHRNFTAGVAATRVLLPLSSNFSSLDTVVSAHSLNTTFGRTVAYTALYEGTSFATLNSSQMFQLADESPRHDVADLLSATQFPIPSPTVLFLKPGHLQALTSDILLEANKSWLYSLVNRHKLSGLREGFISRDSLWDRVVLDPARTSVLNDGADTVRAVVVSGGPIDSSYLTPSRIALSVPLVNAHIHPVAAGPIFASHPLDLQIFPVSPDHSADPFEPLAHIGPPTCNVEVKLAGIDDAAAESGGDPVGLVTIRGPSVGKVMGSGEESYIEVPSASDEEMWVTTGERGTVMANGAFKVLPRK
ncbi:acetyl-CoA synthetase-like protein [Athelia psychrophila]|uniref:Acetyl-CoA synthetase-like protein n=1 Tax=Athelia psychrophila TaxID=1759441 RepID=A0A166JGZ4_9AGAM|nr:acetyl-CoA synthetase-like protein [Fibularhizoctonia sp. CBS 109695]